MRLIDADALKTKAFGKRGGLIHTSDIDKMPTIEPERKHGRWEQVEVSYLADADAGIKESMAIASMFCPVCKRYHNEVYLYGNPTYGVNYCPNCGADMRGEWHDKSGSD